MPVTDNSVYKKLHSNLQALFDEKETRPLGVDESTWATVVLASIWPEIERLTDALDYIDGHDIDAPHAGIIAAAALEGTWNSPMCCNGHGLERRREQ